MIASIVSEWMSVISDPAHLLAESTFFMGEATFGAVVHHLWQKRHDRDVHGHG